MTPQEVIQKFMAELNANNYAYDTSGAGKSILDAAIRNSSKFTGAQAVLDKMFADQTEAEKLAVEEVLGAAYSGQTLSQVSASILNTEAKNYSADGFDKSKYNAFVKNYIPGATVTVADVIKERKAYIFLEKYCGIELANNFWVTNGSATGYPDSLIAADGTQLNLRDNVDTGAITGSDANITLTVGNVVNNASLSATDLSSLKSKYGDRSSLSSDGNTIVIGTGVTKTEASVVPEEGDMYLFTAAGDAKNINTGSNGWVVNATSGDDTITTGGRDSINAGAGNDKITAKADEATITTGAGNDTVEISASVKTVTITDLDASDTISISGTFEVGNAQIENSTLVVTDKTGTRKIRFSDLTNVGNAKIGAQKISDWLSKSGFDISDIANGNISTGNVVSGDGSGDVVSDGDSDGAGRVTIDADYSPNILIANGAAAVEETQTVSSATNINLDEIDITNGTVKSGSTTVGTVSSVTPAVMNFTTRGLTIHVGDGTSTSYNQLNASQKMMVAALFKWWAGESLKLNKDSYGIDFESDTATVTDIMLKFEYQDNSTLALVRPSYRSDYQKLRQLQLEINTKFYGTYEADDKNGISSSSNAGFLDRTLAHEFTHAVMATNINSFSALPQFITEGMAEITHGIDDERGNEIFALAYNADSLSSALSFDSGTGNSIAYSGGFMFLRYLARNVALQTLTDDFLPSDVTATVNLSNGNGIYYVNGTATSEIAATSGNVSIGSVSGSIYTVGNTGVKQKINTGSDAKKIVGVTRNTTVTGGAGSDTIEFVEGTRIDAGDGKNSLGGSARLATITAGADADTLMLTNGSNNNIDLGDGDNQFYIGGTSAKVSINNVPATIYSGYDNTLKGGTGDDTVTETADKTGKTYSYNAIIDLGAGDNVISLYSLQNSSVTTGDGNDTINFGLTTSVRDNLINLGAGNDSVNFVGMNNTIDMGAGDDSVAQSGGNNVFLYNADSGNDTIWFFDSTDTLAIADSYATEKIFTYGNSAPYVDVRVSLKSGDSVTGSVLLKQALPSFDETANIVTLESSAETTNDNIITLTEGVDNHSNAKSNVTILALGGDDKITNTGANVYVDLGDGDDSIYNEAYAATNVTIDGGDGNDTIYTNALYNSISGGDGDDVISLTASSNVPTTINGGAGDDTIYGKRNNTDSAILYEYTSGDGNDTIYEFNKGDTLQIGDGTGTYSTTKSGNDVRVMVGTGSILLKDASTLTTVKIAGEEKPYNPLLIELSEGDDTYTNSLASATIMALAGDDTVSNTGASVYVDLGEGDDSLYNGSYGTQNVTIKGGEGSDTIYNLGNYASISGGDGADSIYSFGGYATIDAGDGDDIIDNHSENSFVDLGDGNDSLTSYAKNSTINGGAGDDYIRNGTDSVSINAGDGNNTVSSGGSNVTIEAGDGNDSISIDYVNSLSINAGDGDNTIKIDSRESSNITIDTGDGNDSIDNWASNVSISTGDGNDSIYSGGASVTIDAGEGDDHIYNTESNTYILGGDGKNTITNRGGSSVSIETGKDNDLISSDGSNSTIDAGDGDDNIINYGANVSINAGAGADSINNYYNYNSNLNTTIDAGDGDDYIYSPANSAYLLGGKGNDLISSGESNVNHTIGTNTTIDGGEGDDTIANFGNSVTVYGGEGADVIANCGGDNVSIDGGEGNDTIEIHTHNYVSHVTINAGAGDDLISLGGTMGYSTRDSLDELVLIQYTEGDGSDTVYGFDANDSLQIGGGKGTYSIATDKDDLVVTVGDESILLKNAASLSSVINISGTDKTPNTLRIELTDGDNNHINTIDGATVLAFDGDDTIKNTGNNVSIDGGEGDDLITSGNTSAGKNSTLNGGDGNDTIGNSGSNVLVLGGTGEDSIQNAADNVTIDAGEGADSIRIDLGSNISINAGEDDDYIYNYGGSNVTIDGGDGDDSIQSRNDNVSINAGDGDDTVAVWESNGATVDGGKGNDSIENQGNNVSINGGDDADTVFNNYGNNVTIDGGDGDDSIKTTGFNVTVSGGDGDDTLLNEAGSNVESNVSMSGGEGDDVIKNYGSVATVDGGDGDDYIYNSANKVLINGGADADSIQNYLGRNSTIDGGDGDDTITNSGNNVTISGGDGDDSIQNGIYSDYGDNVSINGGTGADVIENSGRQVTIDAGADNDTVYSDNSAALIDGGAGDDLISITSGNGNTILGGAGDDTIYGNNLGGNVYVYKNGDGNDVIYNVTEYDMVSITGSYTQSTVGNDIVFAVGTGSLTIKDAADTKLNINTAPENNLSFTGTDDDEKISNVLDNATISALGGDDSITNYGDNVSINADDDNDTIRNEGNNVTIDAGDGDNRISNYGDNVIINAGDGEDTISNSGSKVTINSGDGNEYIHNHTSDVTIDAGDGDDEIDNGGSDVSISGGDGNDTISNYYDEDSDGNDNVTISGGAGDDSIINEDGKNVVFEYAKGDGSDTIEGFNETSTLSISSDVAYSTQESGNDILVEVGDGSILLVDAASLESVNIVTLNPYFIEGTENDDTINNTLDGATIDALGGNDTIRNTGSDVSINAGDGDNDIYNLGYNVTIEAGNGNNYIDNGKIGDSVNAANIVITTGDGKDSIDNSNSNVTINAGAGYDVITNIGVSVEIDGGDGDDDIMSGGEQVTINGGPGKDTIYVEGKSITIDAGEGDDIIINAGEKVSIDAGNGNDSIKIYADDATITTGDGNDTIEVGEDVKSLTVTDFETGDVILLYASVESIAVENDSLIAGNVTIAGISEAGGVESSWTVGDGTAAYTKTTSKGAQLSEDGKTITFTDEDEAETLFTLTGLNEDLTDDDLEDAIEVSDGKIILSKDALGQQNIKLTTDGNYSLALGDDVPTVTKTDKSWTLDDTTATYHDTGKSEGYKLTNSKTVTYTAPVEGKTLLTVTGLKEDLTVDDLSENLTVNGKTLTVKPDVVGEDFSISGGYKVVFDSGDYDGSNFIGTDGKDTIEVNGSGLSLDGGKGNDTITSKNSGNVYLFASDGGKDVIVGYGDDDTIHITDASEVTASVKNNDVVITVGKATMTLKNAAKAGTQVTVVDDDETLIDGTFYTDRIVKDNGATLTSAFKSKSFATDETIQAVDGSATSVKFSLTGGDESNTLTGGKGNNFINGGGGENILTGGKGNDTFATGNGTDTIIDYETSDKISLTADVKDFSTDGDDVILKFDGDKSVTISDGVGKKITFLQNKKSSTEIFTTDGKTNTAGTSITLPASTDTYTASAKILTIDGGLTDSVWIVGNTKANKIFGGNGDDTLAGDSGNDTLTGGDGSDIFIYETGRDVITDYVSGEDTISLAASPTSETLDSKGNVILKFGSNSLTINNVAGQEITFVNDSVETTKTYFSESIVGSDGVTLQSTFKNSTFAATDDFINVDATATTKKLTLTGGDEDNTLIGGKGVNLLNGGAGNDLLIGNSGVDTFVYSSGNDTIGDYETKDRISLTSAMTDFELDDDNVIITFDDGSLTIADAAGKSITFLETTAKGKVTTQINVFAEDGIFNSAKTAATIKADASTFDAGKYSALVTIDGSLASDEIEIVGNKKNNLIYAGDSGSTINGGKGTDTLWGGDGSDLFIHESGKDVIYDFGDDDMLQIGGSFTASVKNNAISFKVGTTSNAITLKDYSATSFNINGDDYQINGKTLTKK